MSKYQVKINLLQEKINKLKEREFDLVKKRKVFIGDLAEKLDLLIYSDACLAGMLSHSKEVLSTDKNKISEYETRGENFFSKKPKQASINSQASCEIHSLETTLG